MSAHNIQLFSGAVEIPDDLRVTSLTVEDSLMELGANGGYANVGYVMNLNDPTGPNAAVYYDKTVDQLRIVHRMRVKKIPTPSRFRTRTSRNVAGIHIVGSTTAMACRTSCPIFNP